MPCTFVRPFHSISLFRETDSGTECFFYATEIVSLSQRVLSAAYKVSI